MQIGHLNGHHPLRASIKRTLHTSDKATVIPAPRDGRRATRSQGWEQVALFSLVTFFVNTKKVTPRAYLVSPQPCRKYKAPAPKSERRRSLDFHLSRQHPLIILIILLQKLRSIQLIRAVGHALIAMQTPLDFLHLPLPVIIEPGLGGSAA